jgi:tRNA(Ile2) C34 agmatinyltransferase TiaS
MACPTCSHTMQNLGAEGQRLFWCPRCGTIKSVSGDHDSVSRPFRCDRYDGLLVACRAAVLNEDGCIRMCKNAIREATE